MAKATISSKNSKNEILEAYNAMLKEVEESGEDNRVQKQKREAEKEVVTNAQASSTSEIIHKIVGLKISTNNSLDELSKQLVAERDKLSNIQEATSIAYKKLEEAHGIAANADSLEALLLTQKRKQEEFEAESFEKRGAFEKEMREAKEVWQKEQQECDLRKAEQEEAYQKGIKRREEEYEYQRKLKEQKDADLHELNRISLERTLEEQKEKVEKELGEREAYILSKEQELKELREASKGFDDMLQAQILEATTRATKDLERQYKFENELKEKEVEGQLSLSKQTIASLEDKLKEKQNIINELNKQLGNAQLQAQELAKKVVEGVSQARQYAANSDLREEKVYK